MKNNDVMRLFVLFICSLAVFVFILVFGASYLNNLHTRVDLIEDCMRGVSCDFLGDN